MAEGEPWPAFGQLAIAPERGRGPRPAMTGFRLAAGKAATIRSAQQVAFQLGLGLAQLVKLDGGQGGGGHGWLAGSTRGWGRRSMGYNAGPLSGRW